MAERLVWFLLVDQEGAAYKGTSAEYVKLGPTSVIAEFRKAVYAENAAILQGIVPAQLLVYADKTAFDANTADVPANLRSSHSLKGENEDVGLGADEDHALLVVVPPHNDPPSPAMTLLEAIVPQLLTHAPTSLTDRNRDFKHNLCKFYGCYSRKKSWVRCMLLDVAFPKSLVIASHLFRRSNEYLSLVMMQISNIDDKRNGLLLFKPLEYALDHFQISFIRDDTDTFRLKLFDPSIRSTPLIDLLDRNGNKVFTAEQTQVLLSSVSLPKKPCRFDVRTTFGDVDGSALIFTGLERPFYRCLNLQARVARMVALKKNWIDATYDFQDFWSEVSLDDKMEMFHRSILNSDASHRSTKLLTADDFKIVSYFYLVNYSKIAKSLAGSGNSAWKTSPDVAVSIFEARRVAWSIARLASCSPDSSALPTRKTVIPAFFNGSSSSRNGV